MIVLTHDRENGQITVADRIAFTGPKLIPPPGTPLLNVSATGKSVYSFVTKFNLKSKV